jgi:hypothetical protein
MLQVRCIFEAVREHRGLGLGYTTEFARINTAVEVTAGSEPTSFGDGVCRLHPNKDVKKCLLRPELNPEAR